MNNFLVKKTGLFVAPILNLIGVLPIVKSIYGGIGHVLMFHRVLPSSYERRIHNHQSLEITTEHLELLIQYFIKRSYDILSLDEFYARLTGKGFSNKFVIFTFDDGYKDNYEFAYPIFKKYNIPFTIYVTTCFPDYTATLWWYALEDLLLKNDELSHQEFPFLEEIKCKTLYQKELAFNVIRDHLLRMNNDQIQHFFSLFDIDLKYFIKKESLSWDDIIELSKDSLVTIGAHTVNHVALSALSDEDCLKEISYSKERIEAKINKPVLHFSYPFGKQSQASTREFNYSTQVGFHTAATTRLANVFYDHKEYLYAIPRLSINGFTTISVLKAQIDGFFPMIRNRFKKVVTD